MPPSTRRRPRPAREACDRGAAVRAAGLPWTSLGKHGMRHSGPGVVVPMGMPRDITASGIVGDATRASAETGAKMVAAVVPRIVQVARSRAPPGADAPDRSGRRSQRPKAVWPIDGRLPSLYTEAAHDDRRTRSPPEPAAERGDGVPRPEALAGSSMSHYCSVPLGVRG